MSLAYGILWVSVGSMVFTSCVGLVAVWEDREHVYCGTLSVDVEENWLEWRHIDEDWVLSSWWLWKFHGCLHLWALVWWWRNVMAPLGTRMAPLACFCFFDLVHFSCGMAPYLTLMAPFYLLSRWAALYHRKMSFWRGKWSPILMFLGIPESLRCPLQLCWRSQMQMEPPRWWKIAILERYPICLHLNFEL